MHKTLITLAISALTLAFAAPSLIFVKDAAMTGKMMKMGDKEVVELAAAPGFSLLARNVAPKHAIFLYSSTEQAKDAQALFEFYEGALLEAGWQAGEAMMGKDGAMMEGKQDGAMMGKKAEGMMGGEAMMAKGLEAHLTLGGHTITLLVRPYGSDRVQVDIVLK